MGVGAKGKGPRLAGEKASQERASSSSDPDAAYDDWVIAQFEKKYARGKKKPAPGWLELLGGGTDDEESDVVDEDAPETEMTISLKRRGKEDKATSQLPKRTKRAEPVAEEDDEIENEDDEDVDDEDEEDEEEEEEEDEDDDEEEEKDEDDEEEKDEDGDNEDEEDETQGQMDIDTAATSSSSSSQKYIPPSLRKEETSRAALDRQVRGLINRLTEANLEVMVDQLLSLSRQGSRNDLTTSLCDAILETISSTSDMLETFIEIGARFLQAALERLQSEYERTSQIAQSRNVVNMALLVSYLYTFGVTSSGLIYDLLNEYAERFGVLDIELIHTFLRYAGFQLRSDDPVALRDLVLSLQPKTAELRASREGGARLSFLLETLTAVKNNRRRVEDERLEARIAPVLKRVKVYLKRHDATIMQPFRIGLADLREAKDKGRWWLVGAAWTGSRVDDKDVKKSAKGAVEGELSRASKDDVWLLEAAKAQGMNTTTRKAVFLIIMTSQDFADAFARLMKLGLKADQEREIIRVLFHCCGHESISNPYYSHLAQRLCAYQRSFAVTATYTLWDFCKELKEASARRILNVATMVAHLIATEALGLVALKGIDLHRTDEPFVAFIRVLFRCLLQSASDVTLLNAFSKATKPEELRDALLFALDVHARALESEDDPRIRQARKIARAALRPDMAGLG